MRTLLAVFLSLSLAANLRSAEIVGVDLAIYGGTSGGIAAAVQAVRMGKKTVIIEPGRHLGGMMSGGLGWIDVKGKQWVGGLGQEFFKELTTRYSAQGINLASFGNESCSVEPHMAEAIFNDWIANHNIRVIREHRLASVVKQGARLRSMLLDHAPTDAYNAPSANALKAGAVEVRAAMFIDATYEGDLMARAGVSYRTDREGAAETGEALAGLRYSLTGTGAAVQNLTIDPYVRPGDASSGLLPMISPGPLGAVGSPSPVMQAYNFRLCLTRNNPLPVAPPANYDPARYELAGRYFAAMEVAGDPMTVDDLYYRSRHPRLLKVSSIPRGKSDTNNGGTFSTDYVEAETERYAEASWAERGAMWRDHIDYTRGLLYFFRTDPRLSEAVRAEVAKWGLARDEFQGTENWPHQIYVRECRRMVGQYVMKQSDCQSPGQIPDSVGMGSYNLDSHQCQKIWHNGRIIPEGGFGVGLSGPYPIPYRTITPRAEECENLFVTFCVSATHVAFDSMRMEPVFMMLSQSAATAAAFAIDDGVAVQHVNYDKLLVQMMADKQVISKTPTASLVRSDNGIVADSEDATAQAVGEWLAGSSVAGYSKTNYLHDNNTGKGAKSMTLRPTLTTAGPYDVYLRWTEHANRATNVPVTVLHQGGSAAHTINQRTNGSKWVKLGTYAFATDGNAGVRIDTAATDGHVVADAALWAPEGQSVAATSVHAIATDPVASEAGDAGRVTITRLGDTAGPLTVNLTTGGNASSAVDYTPLPGTIAFAAGESARLLTLSAVSDAVAEGTEMLTATVAPGVGYSVGPLATAAVRLLDLPFDSWRHSQFDAQQLANPGISGAAADADGDGLSNRLEYALGRNALTPDAPQFAPAIEVIDGRRYLTMHVDTNPAATDVDLAVEICDGLAAANWNTDEMVIVENSMSRLIVRDGVEFGSRGGMRMMRVRLSTR